MSKIIKMTEEHINKLKDEFSHALETVKLSDGKFTFTKNLEKVERKANLYFEELAYWKMQALVQSFDKEVAWHGLAKRGEDPEKDDYIIYDILVYPQEVTGTTVNTDQERYQTWLYEHDDEVFNNIRMQGHSHVNMGVTPSTVDTTLYEQFLEQLEDDMFYIFLIYNKKGDKTIKIYDLAKNILFGTEDVTVYTLDDGTGMVEFLENANKMVEVKTYAPAKTTSAGKNEKTTSGSAANAGNSAQKGSGSTAKKRKKRTSNIQKEDVFSEFDDIYDEYYGYGGYYGSGKYRGYK